MDFVVNVHCISNSYKREEGRSTNTNNYDKMWVLSFRVMVNVVASNRFSIGLVFIAPRRTNCSKLLVSTELMAVSEMPGLCKCSSRSQCQVSSPLSLLRLLLVFFNYYHANRMTTLSSYRVSNIYFLNQSIGFIALYKKARGLTAIQMWYKQ